jgi:hypothetical protein
MRADEHGNIAGSLTLRRRQAPTFALPRMASAVRGIDGMGRGTGQVFARRPNSIHAVIAVASEPPRAAGRNFPARACV